MASSKEDIERDTALYILSYLYNRNYSQTMSAFMSECNHLKMLPEQNVLVLPSVPLEDIVSDYKSRQSTSILAQSMGSQLAWKSLWEKLQLTLTQINNLAQDLNWKKTQPTTTTTSRSKHKLVFRQNMKGPSLEPSTNQSTAGPSSMVPVPSSEPSFSKVPSSEPSSSKVPSSEPSFAKVPSSVPLPESSSIELLKTLLQPSSVLGRLQPINRTIESSAGPFSGSRSFPVGDTGRSPRKKTQPSKRKQVEDDPKLSSGEELQQVVDALLSSEELPTKLADLINQRVESEITDNEPNVIRQTALGSLLTSTDVWLDEIIASTLGTSHDQETPLNTPQKRPSDDDDTVESSSSSKKRLCTERTEKEQ